MDFIFCAVRALSRHPENNSESSNGCSCSLLDSDFNMTWSREIEYEKDRDKASKTYYKYLQLP